MKKRLTKVLSILMSLSMLVACSGGSETATEKASETDQAQVTEATSEVASEDSEDNSDKIQLEFWYPFTGKIQEANEKSVEMFNQSQDKIHVTASTQGNYADVEQKVRQSMAAQTGPDVFINLINTAAGLGTDGITQSLTPYIEADTDFDLSDFIPGILESSTVGADQYGLPYFNSTCLLYFNKTMFDEKGIDQAKLETWDGFKEVASELTEGEVKGVSNNENYWIYESMMMHFSDTLYNEDYTKANFATDAGVKAEEIMVDMKREGTWDFPVPMTSESGETAKQNFFSQKVGMFFASTANLSAFLQGSEENGWELGAVMLPMGEERAASVGGSNIVMANNLDEETAQAAWEFIKFMTSPETNSFASEYTGYLPIRQSVAESEERAALEKDQPLYAVAREQLEFTAPAAKTGKHNEVSAIWKETTEALMTDESMDIKEAMEDLAQRSEDILSR